MASKKHRLRIPPQPPILPAVSPGGILELLLVQKRKGEELLNSEFLSIEDVRYWNLFTKEILTKAFGAHPEYIEAVIYAAEQKPYSAFEPESNLEKMRRRNFEIALKRLESCMKQLNPESTKTEPAEGEEPAVSDEIEDDSPEPEEEEEEDPQDEELPPGKKQSRPETGKRAEEMAKSGGRKVFFLSGADEEKKAVVTKFLKNLGLDPVLPPDEPGEEEWMRKMAPDPEFAFALALLCADKDGRSGEEQKEAKRRLGQKMVFELGFLVGRLKPGRVCALHEQGLDLPSEYPAGLFLPWDPAGLWKLLVARAMKMADLEIDLNKAL